MEEKLEKLGFDCENMETGLLREEHPFYVPVWLLTRSVVERTENLWVFSDYFEMMNWLNIKYAALTVIADEWRGQVVHAIHASGETLEATTGVLHEFESFENRGFKAAIVMKMDGSEYSRITGGNVTRLLNTENDTEVVLGKPLGLKGDDESGVERFRMPV